jgi:hypothetical protein
MMLILFKGLPRMSWVDAISLIIMTTRINPIKY